MPQKTLDGASQEIKNMDELPILIAELQKFDNPKGYKLTHEKVCQELQPVVEKLIILGEESLNELHALLEHEKSWSCLLALHILQHIKSEESILPLVEFIRRTDDSDYWESGEEAMKALTAIGKPAINILIKEIKEDLQKKKQYTYLLGALCEIQDKSVYKFMTELLQDYIKDYKKYDEWFDLVPFVLDFDKHNGKEALPLLEEVYAMKHLSEEEKREVLDTIEQLRDPKEYQRRIDTEMELMKNEFPRLEKNIKKILNPKNGEVDSEEYLKRAGETDEDFEANFKCDKCGERQNLKTGLVWDVDDIFVFEHEIMCRYCHSHKMKLTNAGTKELVEKQMGIYFGKDRGVLPIGKKTTVENKEMPFKKVYKYILNRIKEEPDNAEIYLRAANSACKINKYLEAIEFYQKSMQLNPSLIANYINLIQIYAYRKEYYGIQEHGSKAEELFMKLVSVFNSHQYNAVTIRNNEDLPLIVHQLGERLGFEMHRRKIGRNEPCPCGSGKKYKKCCLEKE